MKSGLALILDFSIWCFHVVLFRSRCDFYILAIRCLVAPGCVAAIVVVVGSAAAGNTWPHALGLRRRESAGVASGAFLEIHWSYHWRIAMDDLCLAFGFS